MGNTDYVEAHGTGTPAGDPVETGALARTLAASRPRGDPLYVGSIKTNIGHLEGASGLAQVIKSVMMLEKGEIPPLLWFDKANPRIPLEEWNVKLATELTAWPNQGLRRISINSFGYGGANAHCIVDDAMNYLKARGLSGHHNVQTLGTISPTSTPDSGVGLPSPLNGLTQQSPGNIHFEKATATPTLLLWTVNEQNAASRNGKILSEYIASKLPSDESEKSKRALLRKLSITLATRRSMLPWRMFAVVNSLEDVVTQLTESAAKPLRVTSNADTAPKLGFVFTGQGAQWFAMGRELCAYPVFYNSLQAASNYLLSIGASWSAETEFFHDEESSNILSPRISQPICTVLQVALVDLLKTWGITPTAVVGHSSGEIGAAYAKGALSRENAWKIAYYRGFLCGEVAPHSSGGMMATGLGPKEAMSYIERVTYGSATVACVNSPESTTVSGDATAIDELEAMIKADGHFARKLRVGVAYHSAHMQVIAQQYQEALSDLETLPDTDNSVTMFSSLTGKEITINSELDAEYWVANLVSPVQFSDAVQCLLKHTDGDSKQKGNASFVDHLVEVGPAAALKGPVKQILGHESVAAQASAVTYQSVLERGKNACETALTAAGRLFQLGVSLDLRSVMEKSASFSRDGFLVDIPPYGWNHSHKYWHEGAVGRAHRFMKEPRKDLFGAETPESIPEEPRFRNILRLREVPWMSSHGVQGSFLYPAAGMMIMAIEAMTQKADTTRKIKGYELRDIIISKAMVIPAGDRGIETVLSLKPFRHGSQALTSSWQEFELFSRVEAWELNCSGLIRLEYEPVQKNNVFADEEGLLAKSYAEAFEKTRSECLRPQGAREFYDHLDVIGLSYKGVFRSLSAIRKGDRQSACQLTIPDTKSDMPRQFEYSHVIHPATLDNVIQMALPAYSGIDEELAVAMVPVSIERLYVSAEVPSAPGSVLEGYSSSEVTGFEGGTCSVVVSDTTWQKPLVIFKGLKCKKLEDLNMDSTSSTEKSLRRLGTVLHWQEDATFLDNERTLELFADQVGKYLTVPDRKTYIELEMASLIICKRALKECSAEESEKFQFDFKMFYDYMQHCLHRYRDGKLPYQNEYKSIDWLGMTTEEEEKLLQRVSETSTDGKALVQHGRALPQILRGEVTPLQVLLPNGGLGDFDRAALGSDIWHAQMSWYVDMLAHKNDTMKILEVGAGKARATLPILKKLGGANGTPRFSSYTFTDINVAYFEESTNTLSPWLPFMDFAMLDITEDPTSQGFEEGSYDLIVASKVIHTTGSVSKVLENIKKLLRPYAASPFQKLLVTTD